MIQMIEEKTLLEVLEKWNLWHHDINMGVERKQYVENILSLIDRKEVLVLTGIRRSGKSTIMKQVMAALLKKGISREQLFYLNLEDYNFMQFLSVELLEFIY